MHSQTNYSRDHEKGLFPRYTSFLNLFFERPKTRVRAFPKGARGLENCPKERLLATSQLSVIPGVVRRLETMVHSISRFKG